MTLISKSTTLAVAVAAIATCSAQSTRPANPGKATTSSGHVWHMRKVDVTTQVTDLQTHGNRSILGMTMLVPTDWTFEGHAVLSPKFDCNYTIGRFFLETHSADQSTGLSVRALGATVWSTNQAALQQIRQMNQQWAGTEDCRIEPAQALQAGLSGAIGMIVPGARAIGSVEPVPGMTDEMDRATEQANAMLAQQAAQHRMPASHLRVETGRLRFSGTIQNHAVEGWVVAMHTVRSDPAPGGSVDLSDIPLFAVMYAPQGQLDASETMLSSMLDSIQTNPEWTAYLAQYVQGIVQVKQRAMNQVAQIYANMAADNARAAQQQAAIRQGARDYGNQVHAGVAANRAAALDHSSQQFALHMGDQAIYTDPGTGQHVQMSSQYGHAWASSTGNSNEYILTDSPSFNPNGQVGSSGWTEMKKEN